MHSDHLHPGCNTMRDALVPPNRTISTFVFSGVRVSSGESKLRASTPDIDLSLPSPLIPASDPNPAAAPSQGCQMLPDSLEGKREVFLRVRIREPEIVRAHLPEGAAGENRDTRVIEKLPRERVGVDRELADVRERVEGTAGARARDSGKRVETVDDELSAACEFGHHRPRLVHRPG